MQICENCGSGPATVHLTRVTNESTVISHLCEDCAGKMGIPLSMPPQETEGQQAASGKEPGAAEKETACPRCHLAFSEFRNKGRLGCPECYNCFEKEIEALLVQVHGSALHRGKLYPQARSPLDGKDAKRLREELDEAIRKERFELAAALRDALHSLDKEPDGR